MEEVLDKLKQLDIQYELVEHGEVYTIEEMENLEPGTFKNAEICKNLFLRDQKGKIHYLVVLCSEKQVDMKQLQEKINSTRLSFASEERLEKYLKLKKGSVTPLAVINDPNKEVIVVLDEDLYNKELVSVHPNTNTASILMSFDDVLKVINDNGNKILKVKI